MDKLVGSELIGALGELLIQMQHQHPDDAPKYGSLKLAFERFLEQIEKLEATEGLKGALGNARAIVATIPYLPPTAAAQAAAGLHRELTQHLREYLLLVVSRSDRAMYETPARWYGERLDREFPSIVADLSAACRCYALQEYTACVFHAMRVAEFGVVALGDLAQIEQQRENWTMGQAIAQVEGRLKELYLRGEDRGSIEFLSEALTLLRGFKDVWRNPVSHGNRQYDRETAERVLDSVRHFMRTLADRRK